MKIASLVLGILALMLCWIPVIGFIMALVALILGIVAVNKKDDETSKGPAIAGIVTSAIAIVSGGIITFVLIVGMSLFNSMDEDVFDRIRNAVYDYDRDYYYESNYDDREIQNMEIHMNEILQNYHDAQQVENAIMDNQINSTI